MSILEKIKQIIKIFINDEVFFVGSVDKLPGPLNTKEEQEYIIKAQNGDINARNKLIEHNLRLVVFLAKKYENTKVDLEDLVSIGTIGLIKGVNTYKLDKKIKLATYASRCIDNEILMYLRKTKKKRTEISFEDSLSYDQEGNELHLEDIMGTDNDIVTKNLEDEYDRNLLKAEVAKFCTYYEHKCYYCPLSVYSDDEYLCLPKFFDREVPKSEIAILEEK